MKDGSGRAVPITMGSPRFETVEVARFRCTHAWFPPNTTLEPHIHDRATFGVMLRGGFDLLFASGAVGHRSLACEPGTVFTEPAEETHGNRVGSGGASVVVIQIDPDAADPTIEPVRRMLVDRINHFQSHTIALQAGRLAREIRSRDRLAALAVESLVLGMLLDAGRRDSRWSRSRRPPAWIELAEQYVRANFRESMRIADIARAAGVHPTYLARVFSRVHGISLATYVRRVRLEWVSDRLAQTDASISSIAHSAGFADQAHLTRAFKRYTGRTPAAYRRATSA